MFGLRLSVAFAIATILVPPGMAKDINIEFLQGAIGPQTIGSLAGIACRNYCKIVHLDIGVNWPADTTSAEQTGYERLVFRNDNAEFLFPKGSYDWQHGAWIIQGYFIARSGGMHQGVVSSAFEKVKDAKVLLNPHVVETKADSSNCR
jgi:hypothetical protein